MNSTTKLWGQGAIENISSQWDWELPRLKGLSVRNLRYMRTFYEEWRMLDECGDFALEDKTSNLALASANFGTYVCQN